MSYKQGFISGIFITVFVTLLTPLMQYITAIYITPHYFANVIDYSVNEGKMTPGEAENYFNLKSYILQSLAFAPVVGLITTAIVAIFIKRKAK